MARIAKKALIFLLFMFLPLALARSAYLELINGTPYDWILVYHHSYSMNWKPPAIVSSGASTETFVTWIWNNNDAGAEATYKIDNPNKIESFTIRARQNTTRIEVAFESELASMNNPMNSVINLGFVSEGAHPFILAGNGVDSPYVGTNPSPAWMQATLPTIGQKTLRKIAMPLAHDAGASEVSHSLRGPGTLHNTQTQSVPVYSQLIFGARVFDIRPMLYRGEWYTYHGSLALGTMWGATGQSIPSIVNDINRFTKEHPGELIILDITHDANSANTYRPFDDDDWYSFYQVLGLIEDLWVEKDGLQYDLSMEPLTVFITPGSKSAVLIRLPCGAPPPLLRTDDAVKRAPNRSKRQACPPRDLYNPELALDITPTSIPSAISIEDFPSTSSTSQFHHTNITPFPSLSPRSHFSPTAFLSSNRLPKTGSFSSTSSRSSLSKDQLAKLRAHKPSPDALLHQSSWILTQPFFFQADIARWKTSILGYAVGAHRALFGPSGKALEDGERGLWGTVTGVDLGEVEGGKGRGPGIKPNFIEVDFVRNSDVAALALAINCWEG
ncbi:Glucan endo-1,3-alpha-glucosidase agn1 [Clarireedia jacksonii]